MKQISKLIKLFIVVVTSAGLLVATLQAADFNLTPYTDLSYIHTSPDTLRNSGNSDVVKLLNAITLTVEFQNHQPLDSAYVLVEASNDEVTWYAVTDSVLVQDDTDHAFIVPFAEAFLYYRGRIETDVGGADTTRTVVKFKSGGTTNER